MYWRTVRGISFETVTSLDPFSNGITFQALERIELAEPPEPDKQKDKLSDLKMEFVNLL